MVLYICQKSFAKISVFGLKMGIDNQKLTISQNSRFSQMSCFLIFGKSFAKMHYADIHREELKKHVKTLV